MQNKDFNFLEVGLSLPYSDDGFLKDATKRTMQIIEQKEKRRKLIIKRWYFSVAASVIVTFGTIFFFGKSTNSYNMTFDETITRMSDSEIAEYMFYADNDLMYYDEI